MSERPSVRALIADDEPLVRERIRSLIAEYDSVEVLAECRDGVETLEAIRSHRPDLVFLDIQMPELTGFQVLAAVDDDELPEIVFVTAHDEYALEAFDVNAVDYVLKPIEPDRFTRAVRRALTRLEDAAARDSEGLRALAEYVRARGQYLERFVVRARGKYYFVPTAAVDWIEGAQNYLVLHTGQRSHMVRGTLTAAEGRLDPEVFERVHRSSIVNKRRIAAIEPLGHGEFVLHLPEGAKVRSSRTYSESVRALLEGLE